VIVVDASVALAWCFEDESSAGTDAALDRLADEGAVVPAIWPFEVANALRTAERRGRLDLADTARLRGLLEALPIEVEPIDLPTAVGDLVDLARTLDLTAYDAAYVALAARRGIPLATIDDRLRRAARTAGVELVG
jgi:predicted nucleic acid-binding protein